MLYNVWKGDENGRRGREREREREREGERRKKRCVEETLVTVEEQIFLIFFTLRDSISKLLASTRPLLTFSLSSNRLQTDLRLCVVSC